MNFPNESMDLIFSNWLLMYLSDQEVAILFITEGTTFKLYTLRLIAYIPWTNFHVFSSNCRLKIWRKRCYNGQRLAGIFSFGSLVSISLVITSGSTTQHTTVNLNFTQRCATYKSLHSSVSRRQLFELWYMNSSQLFKECHMNDEDGNSYELSLVSCKCIGAYVRNKKNQNQVIGLFIF